MESKCEIVDLKERLLMGQDSCTKYSQKILFQSYKDMKKLGHGNLRQIYGISRIGHCQLQTSFIMLMNILIYVYYRGISRKLNKIVISL